MECNKDEAMRAKDIAVRKFTEKDYAGSRKFALKAQTLYPGLEGVSQMLTTLEVYISAENKVNGEMDMYGILGVNPLADDETIKKQYKKRVLLLHPDKNKSIGADGAFQLVTEAFNFLSDKAKRSAYNSRRNIRAAQQKVSSQTGASAGSAVFRQFPQKVPTQGGVSAASPSTGRAADRKVPTQGGVSGASRMAEQTFKTTGSSTSQQKVPPQSGNSAGINGYHKPPSSNSSHGRPRKTGTQKASAAAQGGFRSENTFWTKCNSCMMQYEYIRYYLNQTLKCPQCQAAFIAHEIDPPSNLTPNYPQQKHTKSSCGSGPSNTGFNSTFGGTGARWSPAFGTTYNGVASSASGSAQASSARESVNERMKREYEEAQATARWTSNASGSISRGDGPSKKRREDESHLRNSGGTLPSQTGIGNREAGMGFPPGWSQGYGEAGRANFYQGFSSMLNVNKELSAVDLRKLLAGKALSEIRKKMDEWKMSSEARTASKDRDKAKEKEKQKSKLAKNVIMQDNERYQESSDTQKGSESKMSSLASPSEATEQELREMAAMAVPDPDFHVFDLDRSDSCFGENQVWATYDNDDGMPRFYAMIHEVISSDPFKVRISWLNSKSNSEFGPLDWIARGFIKSCGEFRVGRHETNNMLNSFSHKVKWVKGPRGIIQIYPRKGDIWALYRNWSPDWNEGTSDDVKHVYDMVEVLDDYNEEQGVSVAPLSKAAGFRTIFYRNPDPKEVKKIPKQEMFRFSHQVPSYVLTGEEKPNAPKGYVELDPAATPSELLQVIEPTNKEEQVMETGLK